MSIFAIDPGINGAYAILSLRGEFVAAGELPRFERSLNANELAALIDGFRPDLAVIERVHSMPKQGVASTFTFGTSYGVCIGVCAGARVPLTLVTPARWKAHFRLTGLDKDASRELAIRLYPKALSWLNLKKHHGRSDAILMARFVLNMDAGRKHP